MTTRHHHCRQRYEHKTMRKHTLRTIMLATVLTVLVVLATGTGVAGAVSDKLRFTAQFGGQVNQTETTAKAGALLEDLCTAASGDTCQPGTRGSAAGELYYPKGVALSAFNGDVYIAEPDNRVDEYSSTGEFVRRFGWNVNRTKVEAHTGTQAEKNVCTEQEVQASNVQCQSGEPGGAAGQLDVPWSVTVDPTTGNVYVTEFSGSRVDEFTPTGEFVLTFGREVDATMDAQAGASQAEKDLCTAVSKDTCTQGVEASQTTGEPSDAFSFIEAHGLGIAEGGSPSRPVLFVGDVGRIDEYELDGTRLGEISLKSSLPGGKVVALAAEPGGSSLFFADSDGSNVVRQYSTAGSPVSEFKILSGVIKSLALDPFGRLAVSEERRTSGVLYSTTGTKLSEFSAPDATIGQGEGLAFDSKGNLFSDDSEAYQGESFELVPIADLTTGSVTGLTSTSATLNGEINPKGVTGEETVAWFQYGVSEGLGSSTLKQNVGDGSGFVPVQAGLAGLLPNQKYYYRLAGEDASDHAPEAPLTDEKGVRSFTTVPVAPLIEGAPAFYFVTSESAVLSASVNPENANTTYRFQYGACETLDACPGVKETPVLQSSDYAMRGAMQTVKELQPDTIYHYRLVAVNEHAEKTIGQESALQTAAAPSPSSLTGVPSEVGVTVATLNGTVFPSGRAATYLFQIGVYDGAGTVYGTVASGPVPASTEGVGESVRITGLQPGVTYAYRIVVVSPYVSGSSHEAFGGSVVFTTTGLPNVLFAPVTPGLLPTPPIAFPKATGPVGKKKQIKKHNKKKSKHSKAHRSAVRSRRK